jgi:hypothetical protein
MADYRFNFEFTQLATDGAESRLAVDYMRQCGDAYARTYPAEA